MHASVTPDFDLAHRVERVTNISPASDAFVIFTLATLFFTIGCFALWMWIIWRRSSKVIPRDEAQIHVPVSPSAEKTRDDDEDPAAPWEKPADWWNK